MVGLRFSEVMEGTLRRAGEAADRALRLSLDVAMPDARAILTSGVADLRGHVRAEGLWDAAPAEGRLELSPIAGGVLRYAFAFMLPDGRRFRFDGRKRTSPLRPLRSMTTLTGVIYDDADRVFATARLRFSLLRHLPGMLRTLRIVPAGTPRPTNA